MAADTAGAPRPGVMSGRRASSACSSASSPGEARVVAGRAAAICRTRPGYRPGDYGMAISTIHEARFVLFDDDTQVGVHHELRRPVGRVHGGLLHVRADARAVRRHLPARRRLRRPSGPGGGAGVHPRRPADRGRVRPELRRHGEGDPQGAAGERRVPAGARPSRCRRRRCSIRRCSRCSTRPPTDGRRRQHRASPCQITSPARERWPNRSPTSPTSTRSRARNAPGRLVLVMNTLPFAQPSDLLLGRAHLPIPAAPAHARPAARARRRSPSATASSCSTASSPRSTTPTDGPASTRTGSCTTPAGDTVALRGERRARRRGARRAGVRRTPLGSVHHGCPGRAEDDRHRRAGLHRSQLDLPRRQERPQPRRRARHRAARTAPSWSLSSPRRSPGAASTCGSSGSGAPR